MPTADREGLRKALSDDIADLLLEGGALSPRHFADRLLSGATLSDFLTKADSAERVEAERDEARAELDALRLDVRLNEKPVFSRRQIIAQRAAAQAEVARLSAEVEALRAALTAANYEAATEGESLRLVKILAKLDGKNAWDVLLSSKADWGVVRQLWRDKLIAGDKTSLGHCSNLYLTEAGQALSRTADQAETRGVES